MGIATLVSSTWDPQRAWDTIEPPFAHDFGLIYLEISISLNVLLTFMIVLRLGLHNRSFSRAAMKTPGGICGLYKATVTIFIESCALYTVSSLVFIRPLGAGSDAASAVMFILSGTQVRAFPHLQAVCVMRRRIIKVIAPLLVIQSVAGNSVLTNGATFPGNSTDKPAIDFRDEV